MLPLLLIIGLVSMVTSQCLQGANLNVSTETFPPTEDLLFVAPQSRLQQVIVPEMRFNCYGYVTSWSALTVVDNTTNLLSLLDYWITFTLWRPNANKGYDLVGTSLVSFDNLQMDPIDNSTGLVPQRYSYFRFVNREPTGNLSFQPRDVIGWTIERNLEVLANITGPVSVVYRKATNRDQGSVDILYFSYSNNTREDTVCSIGHCERLTNESSVLPYINIHYIETTPEEHASNNFNCLDRGEMCPVISSEIPTQPQSSSCAGADCPTHPGNSTIKDDRTVLNLYYILGGTFGGFFLIISVFIMLILLYFKWKNDCGKITLMHDPASANMGISDSGSPAIWDMNTNAPYASPTTLAFSAAMTTNESNTAPTNQLENCVMDGNPSYGLNAGTGAEASTGPAAEASTGPAAEASTGPAAEANTGPVAEKSTGPAAEANTGPVAETSTGGPAATVFTSNPAYGCRGDIMFDSASCDYEQID